MQEPNSKSALIVGAGIVGSTCAYRFAKAGWKTTLLDANTASASASFGNAGHIATEQIEPMASWASIRAATGHLFALGGPIDVRDFGTFLPWLCRFVKAARSDRLRDGRSALQSLMSNALPSWHLLVNELGQPELLKTGGHVILWESERTARRRSKAWRTDHIDGVAIRDLHAVELDAFGQVLGTPPQSGIRFGGTAQIASPSLAMQALRSAFVSASGHYECIRAHLVGIENESACVVLADGRRLVADAIVIAAGIESRSLLESIGHTTPLIAERGYHVHWPDHRWPANMPPVVFEDRSVILTRFNDGLRLAGFTEFAASTTPPDPRKWFALRAHAAELGLPTIGDGVEWMGARPTLPDYLPAIGRSPRAGNLLYAFGHQHLGLTLAPITADIIFNLAATGVSRIPLMPFDIQRFSSEGTF